MHPTLSCENIQCAGKYTFVMNSTYDEKIQISNVKYTRGAWFFQKKVFLGSIPARKGGRPPMWVTAGSLTPRSLNPASIICARQNYTPALELIPEEFTSFPALHIACALWWRTQWPKPSAVGIMASAIECTQPSQLAEWATNLQTISKALRFLIKE